MKWIVYDLNTEQYIYYIFYSRIHIPSVYWENRACAYSVHQALLSTQEGLGTRLPATLTKCLKYIAHKTDWMT